MRLLPTTQNRTIKPIPTPLINYRQHLKFSYKPLNKGFSLLKYKTNFNYSAILKVGPTNLPNYINLLNTKLNSTKTPSFSDVKFRLNVNHIFNAKHLRFNLSRNNTLSIGKFTNYKLFSYKLTKFKSKLLLPNLLTKNNNGYKVVNYTVFMKLRSTLSYNQLINNLFHTPNLKTKVDMTRMRMQYRRTSFKKKLKKISNKLRGYTLVVVPKFHVKSVLPQSKTLTNLPLKLPTSARLFHQNYFSRNQHNGSKLVIQGVYN